AYCGAKPQKPPLQKLYFHLSLHNTTDQQEWILLPTILYPNPTQHRHGGVSSIEVLSDREHKVKLLRFMGTARMQPEMATDAGGFQAVLVPAGATVQLRSIVIAFWERPDGSL